MREVVSEYLEELEAKTEIIPIELGNEDDRRLLKEYGDSDKSLTFNEFLASKVQERYPGKIIVAEIRGDMHHTLGSTSHVVQHISSAREDRDNHINIDGCNFSGCRLVDVKLMGILENVSFRDCHLEKVKASRATFKGVDFRGASFEEISFDWIYASSSKITVEFSNLQNVQQRGLFVMIDDGAARDDVLELNNDIATQIDEAKKRIFQLTWRQSLTFDWTAALNDPEKQEEFRRVQRDLDHEKKERMDEIKKRYKLSFSQVSSDKTYTPNQEARVAQEERQYVTATKELLEQYKASKTHESFNEFVAGHYRQQDPERYQIAG